MSSEALKMDKTKVITSIYVDKEILEHSKTNVNIPSISEFFCLKYRADFMDLETLKQKLYNHYIIIEDLKAQIKALEEQKSSLKVPENAVFWLKNTGLDRVSAGFSLKNVLKFFNSEFQLDFSVQQFSILIDEIKKEKKEE